MATKESPSSCTPVLEKTNCLLVGKGIGGEGTYSGGGCGCMSVVGGGGSGDT